MGTPGTPNTLALWLLEGDHIRDRGIIRQTGWKNYYRRWTESDGTVVFGATVACTMTGAPTYVVDSVAHGLPAGTAIQFVTVGTSGASLNTTYYVCGSPLVDHFQVSLTPNGLAFHLAASAAGSYHVMTAAKATYTYDEATDAFTSDTTWVYDRSKYVVQATRDYDYANPYTVADAEIDVPALIRTTELIQNMLYLKNEATYAVFVKMGIARQMTWVGANASYTLEEVMSTFNKYQMACNVGDFDVNDKLKFITYQMPEDVNDAVIMAGQPAVVEKRNYTVPRIVCESQLTPSMSLELTMTSEGRIFDFMLITQPRVDMIQ